MARNNMAVGPNWLVNEVALVPKCLNNLYFFLEDTANTTCTMEMYGNDLAAYWACKTQFAHQSNWFPSPIAGLFSYEVITGVRISILLTYSKCILSHCFI